MDVFEEVQKYTVKGYYVHKRLIMKKKITWAIVEVCENMTQVYHLRQIKIDQPTKFQT